MISIIVKVNNEDIIVNNPKQKLRLDDNVIIQSKNGLEYGTVKKILHNQSKKSSEFIFVRKATNKDSKIYHDNSIAAQKAFIKCRELVKKYKLPMKLVNSYYTFDKDQLIFRFISDERVDFRKLAKDLANIYKTRIELRQIGVRDKARTVGGCGQCGRQLCCKGFLKEFNSVSINMAKNQNIALNPTKINGVCGRLLCCLKYEDDTYKELKQELPNIGSKINTKKGLGKVNNINPLKGTFTIIDSENNIIECDLDDCIK